MSEQRYGPCQRALERLLGEPVEIREMASCSGGCVSDARRVETNRGRFFVKRAPDSERGLLEAEAAGLEAIGRTGTLHCPAVIGVAAEEDEAFLVLEWLDLSGRPDSAAMEALGRSFAAFHAREGKSFGWDRDNFIGPTPQINTPGDDWAAFFRDCRLAPQFRLARERGYHFPEADRLLDRVEALLEGHRPRPSPLHGDLWGGNVGVTGSGVPVVFDPAFYFGDRETDLAMTRMFGGFSDAFYRTYEKAFPLGEGAKSRIALYNLYHTLNHANLFGGSYAANCTEIIRSLV